ncbi:hypothetical protein AXW84_20995 [Hymenobacter sp. PAMC 26628]|nr:porin family protein [Hymenobacter sp. PAMC 26628]AMJ67617.1 hypothetical protein AXW84_20995 [Hymenobacter sp. PAMC 26628]
MKKTILFTVLLAVTAAAAHAQSPSFGIKAGASLTNVVGSSTMGFDIKNKLGFHGGFIANLPINDVFSIQPELLYSMKGYKINEDDGFGAMLERKQTLDYIDIPVLAPQRWRFVLRSRAPIWLSGSSQVLAGRQC